MRINLPRILVKTLVFRKYDIYSIEKLLIKVKDHLKLKGTHYSRITKIFIEVEIFFLTFSIIICLDYRKLRFWGKFY